jgi:CubicO group peptidase (beta-lactamase class C family)
MDISHILFRSLAVGAGLALTLRSIARPASANPISKSVSHETVDAYVERQRRRLNLPGVSLAIVEGDQIVHQRGFGRARPGGEAPCPQTPFLIGSLTKSFTALAIMQLVEAGTIALDAPVQCYLPWFRVADRQASAQMNVRHLLNQTSGLPNASGEIILAEFDSRPGAGERQARALATVKLTRPVGAAWEYSNSNYQLLGLIIEAASGTSYASYVQKHILTPLAMRNTDASPAETRPNDLAVGHQLWFGMPFAAPDMPMPYGALAGGGLVSSAEDLARFMIAHLNGGRLGDVQIVSSASIDELHRGAVDIRAYGLSLGQYGMGWCADKIGSTPLVWHGGTLPHFGAFMALLPEQHKGIVLLVNACHHWMNPVLAEFGLGATALLADEQRTPVPVTGLIPWLLRAQALVPALQVAEVAATLRQLHRQWRMPARQQGGARRWVRHLLLPLIPNLLVALSLKPMLSKRRDYLRLYMPDYAFLAWVCGTFALLWSVVRTGLMLGMLSERNKRRQA